MQDEAKSESYQSKVNKGGVPSEDVVGRAKNELARKDRAEKINHARQEMAQGMQKSMSGLKTH
ncbi:hypothetical protein [Methanolobus chelungpuianus]|uniref:Uncharacterized protein n=1 Tax=Methanolobus chelungpuianus TaxID=502115 RepID=A0AAE3HC07_9EURY|nr:hypothetical protein [Methanolobus chelungpuianus]MCQ6963571.1 hypothetical protein [Methanolobus chelungpuianus]